MTTKEPQPKEQKTKKQLTDSEKAKLIEGFKINHMKMKDEEAGEVLWQSFNWDFTSKDEDLPKELLSCATVVREINFSSKEQIEDLNLVQNFYLFNDMIEVSKFTFGFVIPNSTNNWEQYIISKDPEEMIPYNILSGNLVVETIFSSADTVLIKNRIKIHYK